MSSRDWVEKNGRNGDGKQYVNGTCTSAHVRFLSSIFLTTLWVLFNLKKSKHISNKLKTQDHKCFCYTYILKFSKQFLEIVVRMLEEMCKVHNI